MGIGLHFFLNIEKKTVFQYNIMFEHKDQHSVFFNISGGVQQGNPLSPTFFNIFINDS